MLNELLLQYEKDFFIYDFFSDKINLGNRIHDDFMEYSKSGSIYCKTDIIQSFALLKGDRGIEIEDFQIEELGEGIILAHYVSLEKETQVISLRTSIWKKVDNDWKLYFHQGTKKQIAK